MAFAEKMIAATDIEVTPLHVVATGYVSDHAGSVAGANTLLLRGFLEKGNQVAFHSKPDYVDPRPLVENSHGVERFAFVSCSNGWPAHCRNWAAKRFSTSHPLRYVAGRIDNNTYRRGVVRAMRRTLRTSQSTPVVLALGTWIDGRIDEAATVSWVQGPPGTDARSISRHRDEIVHLGGRSLYAKLRAYAMWRDGFGLPDFEYSDHLIVGSKWSMGVLHDRYGLPVNKLHALPYPIDLDMFRPPAVPRPTTGPLQVLWLGRFVPRKRLGLLLDGAAAAIRQGVDVKLTIVGQSGFVPNYERLIETFPYPERIEHIMRISRADVPDLMHRMDVLAQPSDEENFGSSVAEALACGMPVIVGATNGTGDYMCDRSIRLEDDKPETFTAALASLAQAKRAGDLADSYPSRCIGEKYFDPAVVTDQLIGILVKAVGETSQ